jgi:hypothetical protein
MPNQKTSFKMSEFRQHPKKIYPHDLNMKEQDIGVGATNELDLRVSVAALVSVLFDNPEDGQTMLALERTATRREINGRSEITVKAKPFGGGVRLTNPKMLKELIGDFNYDSEQSRRESDFRILIRQMYWEKIKEICQAQLNDTGSGILDHNPDRELAEEFEDTLQIKITRKQYQLKQRGTVVEDLPVRTHNPRASGLPTVRFYYVFEALIEAPVLIKEILFNSRRYSDEDLRKMVLADVRQGGKGRANTILALRLEELKDVYRSVPTEKRNKPLLVGEHQLDRNVQAILMSDVNKKDDHS